MQQTKSFQITMYVNNKPRKFYVRDEIYVLPCKKDRYELGVHIWLPLSYYLNGKWREERIKVEEI